MIFVFCIRHPDYENEYEVIGGNVEIIDIDLGSMNLDDPVERESWITSHQRRIDSLARTGQGSAVAKYQELMERIDL